MEKAAAMTFDELISLFAAKMEAPSIQPDYLGVAPKNGYTRTMTHKLENNVLKTSPYTTDNSYKLAGGGIMSTIVDLGKFCSAFSQNNYFSTIGSSSMSFTGAHSGKTNAYLRLSTGPLGEKQCLVLMTNTQHSGSDLPSTEVLLRAELKKQGIWK